MHPPLYYVLIHFIGKLPVPFDIAARAASGVFLLATLGVVNLIVRPFAPLHARLALTALIIASTVFFYYSQEARSYALLFFITSLQVCFAAKYLDMARAGGAGAPAMLALVMLGVIGTFTHYYALLSLGGIFLGLVVLAPTVTRRAVCAGCGLATLPPVLAFMTWHAGRRLYSTEITWMSNAPGWLLDQLELGLRMLAGPKSSAAAYLVVIGLFSAAGLAAVRRGGVAGFLRAMPPAFALTAIAFVFTIASAFAVSALYGPVFSFKVVLVAAPFFWVAVAGLLARSDLASRAGRIGLCAIVLLSAVSALRLVWRDDALKQEWRASARHVADDAACRDTAIPVAAGLKQVSSKPFNEIFYHHYLPPAFGGDLPTAPISELSERVVPSAVESRLQAIASGDPCDIVLWSVPFLPEGRMQPLFAWLEDEAAREGVADLELIAFRSGESANDVLGWLFSRRQPPFAYIVEAAERPD